MGNLYTIGHSTIKYELFRVGATPPYIRDLFDEIIEALDTLNVKVIFKVVDGEVTMNSWFSTIFTDFLDKALDELQFDDIVKSAINYTSWPVSDLIHLFKCARAHVQGHLTCLDPSNFICLNMQLLEEAT